MSFANAIAGTPSTYVVWWLSGAAARRCALGELLDCDTAPVLAAYRSGMELQLRLSLIVSCGRSPVPLVFALAVHAADRSCPTR